MTFSHVLQLVMLTLGLILLWDYAKEGEFSLKQKVGLALLFMAAYSVVSDFMSLVIGKF